MEEMTQCCMFHIFRWVYLRGEGCASCSLTLWIRAWLGKKKDVLLVRDSSHPITDRAVCILA